MNGVVNVSVLDGWWDEGWTGDNGWAIGGREHEPRRGRPGLGRRAGPLPDPRGGDRAALLRARRATAGPRAWIELMRRSMASTIWRFSTTRMLHDYVEQMYLPRGRSRTEAAAETGRRRPRCRSCTEAG